MTGLKTRLGSRRLYVVTLSLVAVLAAAWSLLPPESHASAQCCSTCYARCQERFDGCFQNCIDMLPERSGFECANRCALQFATCENGCSENCTNASCPTGP